MDTSRYTAVPAKVVLDTSAFASTDETRYYLNGVYIHTDADGMARAVATNGPTMGVTFVPNAVISLPCIIRTTGEKDFVAALKRKRADDKGAERWLVVDHATGIVSIVFAGDAEQAIITVDDGIESESYIAFFKGLIIDGEFPDYERVVPATTTNEGGAFNALYLKSFGNLAESSVVSLRASSEDGKSPYIVRVDGRHDFFGVVMPVAITGSMGFPDWWKAENVAPASTSSEQLV